ncbi:MAG: hypothetical protein C4324_00205 [Blastocatellia bacterium]
MLNILNALPYVQMLTFATLTLNMASSALINLLNAVLEVAKITYIRNMKNFALMKIYFLAAALIFGGASILAQVDVPRKTTAITYPLDETVFVQFRGTTRFPRMKGEAKVRRTARNGTQIELSVSKMPRPFELGRGYATYVLWAVSPDGQVDNLGEIKRRGFFEFDSKITVTTPLQTFALIVTAEPHFLVRRPSQEIMLENVNPYTISGRTITTMPAIQYFGNSSDYFRDPRTPEIAEFNYSKTPSTLLQAKQAIALAKFAGAERDAADELREAETLFNSAEEQWKAGRKEDEVDLTARRAISVAVKAETVAGIRQQAREKRNEQARNDAEIREAENKYQEALSQIEELKTQLNNEIRARELSERDVANSVDQIRDLRAENARLREENARLKLELENARSKIADAEKEKEAAIEEKQREAKAARIKLSSSELVQILRKFGTVEENTRGIVLTLAETYWSNPRAVGFAPAAVNRIAELGAILSKYPDFRVQIEAHTDAQGDPQSLENFTQARAEMLAERLFANGVTGARLAAKGMGATLPIAPNTTAANRAKNRRIQLILVPNI